MKAVETKDLLKKYGEKTAVDNISFSVDEGELFALLGVNGAGKTTTIRMLCCLSRPCGGEAYVCGENVRMQFGDWVALDAEEGSYFGATPNDLTCTAYFAYSTGLFVKAAEVLGHTEDVKEYTDLYNKIVDKFQRTFYDENGEMTAQTQTAHIVALYFGLAPEKYKEKTVQGLLRLLEKENGHLVTGFVGTPYFCHALSQNGHVKEAYELLLKDDFPSWLYQVKITTDIRSSPRFPKFFLKFFQSIQTALEYVFELAKHRRLILVIDEYPYVARVSLDDSRGL